MKTYCIPNTDLVVSRLAYGTWHLGGSWDTEPPNDEIKTAACELVETCVELGINHVDLADIYTLGKSDAVIGHVLRNQPGLRDRLVLQGKCGIILRDSETGAPGRYDFSYDHLVAAVEGTLQRLGTDWLDLLAFHRPDPLMNPAEVARAMDDLHSSGKVRYFGVSNHSWSQIALLQKYVNQPLVLNQLELNLLHHHLITDGILVNQNEASYRNAANTLDFCRQHDMLIQAWSPVARGAVFDDQGNATQQRVAAALRQTAGQLETTPDAVALAWLLFHPAPIQPILGTLKTDRLTSGALADSVSLGRWEWYQLLEAALGSAVP